MYELCHPSHRSFHLHPLSDAEEARGLTRFYRWHIDARAVRTSTAKGHHVARTRGARAAHADRQLRRRQWRHARGFTGHDGLRLRLPSVRSPFTIRSGMGAAQLCAVCPAPVRLDAQTRARAQRVWGSFARAKSSGATNCQATTTARSPRCHSSWLKPADRAARAFKFTPTASSSYSRTASHSATSSSADSYFMILMRPMIAPSRVYAHEWRRGDLAIFQ